MVHVFITVTQQRPATTLSCRRDAAMVATLDISSAVLQTVFLGGVTPNTPAVKGDVLLWSDNTNATLSFTALDLKTGASSAYLGNNFDGIFVDSTSGDLIAADITGGVVSRTRFGADSIADLKPTTEPLSKTRFLANGVAISKQQSIFWTDDDYSVCFSPVGADPQPCSTIRRRDSDGAVFDEATLMAPQFGNGVALSPDESTLYVALTRPLPSSIQAFDVATDGSLSRQRTLVTSSLLNGADGLAIRPSDGTLFVACGDHVAQVTINSEGRSSEVRTRDLVQPGRVQGVAFDAQRETLFIAARGSILSLSPGVQPWGSSPADMTDKATAAPRLSSSALFASPFVAVVAVWLGVRARVPWLA